RRRRDADPDGLAAAVRGRHRHGQQLRPGVARKLSAFVHGLVDDEGRSHSFGPNDDVPAWAAALITNEKAWADGDAASAGVDGDTEPAGGAADAAPAPDGGNGETPPADELE